MAANNHAFATFWLLFMFQTEINVEVRTYMYIRCSNYKILYNIAIYTPVQTVHNKQKTSYNTNTLLYVHIHVDPNYMYID